MAFYIIEKSDQLSHINSFGDCFISFIPYNDNFHPVLTSLSLIYLRSLTDHKGYIFCLDHNESFSLTHDEVYQWIDKNTNKLFVLDKKKAMYWYNNPDKLHDVNFIEAVDFEKIDEIPCINFYYNKHNSLPKINCLIPISKHYEKNESVFTAVLPIISKFKSNDSIFDFNNTKATNAFHQIEKTGLKLDRKYFVEHYGKSLKHPEFNVLNGKIYTHYNLYTITSRPSNAFNGINFAALPKESGERTCYIPENDKFLELDIQGMHPRILGEQIGFNFPKDKNTYELLADLLGVDIPKAKELTFKQTYGGVWEEYKNKPFFKEVDVYSDDLWSTFQFSGHISTFNRVFYRNLEKMDPHKLLNYIIQSYETYININTIEIILKLLENKKTKLVLYTYDSFLLDYSEEDKQVLKEIIASIKYPLNIKQGKSYHGLEKI